MKIFLISYIIIVFITGCTNDKSILPDQCIGCTFSCDLNEQNWIADPYSCHFVSLLNGYDTTFFLSIYESPPLHDEFIDALVFYQLPYDTGIYVIDTMDLVENSGIKAEFWVYEYEFDTPVQEYFVIPDGTSYINIEYLDKLTKAFKISFELKMSVAGGIDGPLYNSSYPTIIKFSKGKAEGHIGDE